MESFQVCLRCNKEVGEIGLMKKLCYRCHDILEFGYPSFTSYQLKENHNEHQGNRMDLSKGWTIPSYLSSK
jgi:hypothetical protein